MGRSALIIPPAKLAACVAELEAANTYSNLTELCNAVSASEWGKSVRNTKMQIRGISPQSVYKAIRDNNTPHTTKAGKRGRAVGSTVSKVSRADKLSKKPVMAKFSIALLKEVSSAGVPDNYKGLAEQAIAGSFKAAIHLHCAQCAGYTSAYKSCDGALGGVPCGLYPANLLMFPNRRVMVEEEDGFWTTEKAPNA